MTPDDSHPDDEPLAQMRGEEYWWVFVRDSYPRLIHAMYLKTRDRELAKDLVQDAFLHFFKSSHESCLNPDRYLYAIASNLVRTHFRKLHRTLSFEDASVCLDSIPAISSEEWPVWDMERILDQLSPVDALILELLLQGRRIQEVADHMGMTYSTAAVRLHRLRQRLLKISGSST